MNELNIQLFSLIGLRALAEYDSIEYRRATDISKRELESKIKELLSKTEDNEAKAKYEELKNIEMTSESNSELNFLLKQIYSYCFQKAQHLSLKFTRDNSETKSDLYRQRLYSFEEQIPHRKIIRENDFIKLGVMRLLKLIEGYEPQFDYQWKNQTMDCLLNPIRKELPIVVIETKLNLRNVNRMEAIIKQIKSFLRFWGKNSIGVLLTTPSIELKDRINSYLSDNIFILLYDVEKDDFVGEDVYKLVNKINKLI